MSDRDEKTQRVELEWRFPRAPQEGVAPRETQAEGTQKAPPHPAEKKDPPTAANLHTVDFPLHGLSPNADKMFRLFDPSTLSVVQRPEHGVAVRYRFHSPLSGDEVVKRLRDAGYEPRTVRTEAPFVDEVPGPITEKSSEPPAAVKVARPERDPATPAKLYRHRLSWDAGTPTERVPTATQIRSALIVAYPLACEPEVWPITSRVDHAYGVDTHLTHAEVAYAMERAGWVTDAHTSEERAPDPILPPGAVISMSPFEVERSTVNGARPNFIVYQQARRFGGGCKVVAAQCFTEEMARRIAAALNEMGVVMPAKDCEEKGCGCAKEEVKANPAPYAPERRKPMNAPPYRITRHGGIATQASGVIAFALTLSDADKIATALNKAEEPASAEVVYLRKRVEDLTSEVLTLRTQLKMRPEWPMRVPFGEVE